MSDQTFSYMYPKDPNDSRLRLLKYLDLDLPLCSTLGKLICKKGSDCLSDKRCYLHILQLWSRTSWISVVCELVIFDISLRRGLYYASKGILTLSIFQYFVRIKMNTEELMHPQSWLLFPLTARATSQVRIVRLQLYQTSIGGGSSNSISSKVFSLKSIVNNKIKDDPSKRLEILRLLQKASEFTSNSDFLQKNTRPRLCL